MVNWFSPRTCFRFFLTPEVKNFPLDPHVLKSIVLIPCDFSKHQRRFNFPQYLKIYLPCHDLINLMMRGPPCMHACMHGTSNSSTLLAHWYMTMWTIYDLIIFYKPYVHSRGRCPGGWDDWDARSSQLSEGGLHLHQGVMRGLAQPVRSFASQFYSTCA